VIAVRVLRERAVVREQILRELPVTIGRDPANDVVLLDASVSHRHARLRVSPEGCPELVDLDSKNGIHRGPERVQRLAILGVVRCRVGLVELEIERSSDTPTLEIAREEWQRFDRRKGVGHHLAYLALGVAAWVAFITLDPGFWSPWQKQRLVTVLWSILGMLIAQPVLAFTLLVFVKAAGRPVRMSDTLLVVARALWLWPLLKLALLPCYYVLGSAQYGWLEGGLTILALVAGIVMAAGVRRRPPNLRFRLVWGLAVTALVAAFVAINLVSERKTGSPEVDFHVQPPIAGSAGRAESLERYMAAVRAAAERAARAAEEVRQRQDGE
jgi:hypothetical protein